MGNFFATVSIAATFKKKKINKKGKKTIKGTKRKRKQQLHFVFQRVAECLNIFFSHVFGVFLICRSV